MVWAAILQAMTIIGPIGTIMPGGAFSTMQISNAEFHVCAGVSGAKRAGRASVAAFILATEAPFARQSFRISREARRTDDQA